MATLANPKHKVVIVNQKTGAKYDVTGALTDLYLDESENGVAQKVTLKLPQLKHEGSYLTSLINMRDGVFVYADTGGGNDEVFRGYVWKKKYKRSETDDLELIVYDRLIWFKESEEYKFYSAGKSTKSIFQDICSSKGVSLTYNHSSIKHSKLVIKGSLADAFENTLLEEVRKKTGKRGVLRSTKGNIEVITEGKGNSTVYKFYFGDGGNIISTEHTETYDGITTKVIIIGSETADKQAPIRATVKGNTATHGTVQKIITSSDSDNLADLKAEADQMIKDYGEPQKSVSVTAVNNPWVRKGDKIHLNDGYVSGYAYVKSVSHDALKMTMSMELRMA
jgi:hypothetical protein